jgi:hypothetical protein
MESSHRPGPVESGRAPDAAKSVLPVGRGRRAFNRRGRACLDCVDQKPRIVARTVAVAVGLTVVLLVILLVPVVRLLEQARERPRGTRRRFPAAE